MTKTKELIEYLGKARGDKLTKADEEIIQRLREYDELQPILLRILNELEEAYIVYHGDSK